MVEEHKDQFEQNIRTNGNVRLIVNITRSSKLWIKRELIKLNIRGESFIQEK